MNEVDEIEMEEEEQEEERKGPPAAGGAGAILPPGKGAPPRRIASGDRLRRSSKGGWTPEDDKILRRAVNKFSAKNWKKIAEYFPDRTDVQCLHRWVKVRRVKGPLTKEEDAQIVQLVARFGPKSWSDPRWAEIAKELPDRTENDIKNQWWALNHWKSTMKRTVELDEEEVNGEADDYEVVNVQMAWVNVQSEEKCDVASQHEISSHDLPVSLDTLSTQLHQISLSMSELLSQQSRQHEEHKALMKEHKALLNEMKELQVATMTDAGLNVGYPGLYGGSGAYQWKVLNFSELTEKNLYDEDRSEVFEISKDRWRLFLYTSKIEGMDYLSLYLEFVGDARPIRYRKATFTLGVRSQTDPSIIVKKVTEHIFHTNQPDWGYKQFIPLKDLQDPEKGFLINDSIIVEVQMCVRSIPNER